MADKQPHLLEFVISNQLHLYVGKPDSRRFYSAWIADATELDGVTMLAGYGKTVAEAILDLTFSIEGRTILADFGEFRLKLTVPPLNKHFVLDLQEGIYGDH